MTSRAGPRPGGRSARVQAAVHDAVRALLAEGDRAMLTVPLVASRAGVTPSTIYRRWGELADLLADVAVQRMRPETDPADTGSVAGDLQAWAEQYLDEMSSEVGVAMLRDVLAARANTEVPAPCQCATITALQVATIVERGRARGEAAPAVDAVMDGVVAPIVFRALFANAPATRDDVARWLAGCLATGLPPGALAG